MPRGFGRRGFWWRGYWGWYPFYRPWIPRWWMTPYLPYWAPYIPYAPYWV